MFSKKNLNTDKILNFLKENFWIKSQRTNKFIDLLNRINFNQSLNFTYIFKSKARIFKEWKKLRVKKLQEKIDKAKEKINQIFAFLKLNWYMRIKNLIGFFLQYWIQSEGKSKNIINYIIITMTFSYKFRKKKVLNKAKKLINF